MRWRAPARASLSAIAGALAALPLSSPLDIDPTLPRHDRPGGVSIARRKDREPASAAPEVVPTLGTILNLHTDEATPLSETEPTMDRFSDLLADKALRGRIDIAPRLLEAVRALVRPRVGARVDVVSGYRSPKRNEMMRKKGRHVASQSQHTLGRAIDLRVEGATPGDLVRQLEAMKWDGGIGRYDEKHDRFVHVDVGPNRRWRGK